MGQVIAIKANGEKFVNIQHYPPSLEYCQRAVATGTQDALIEIVRVEYEGKQAQMIVHESGLLVGIPFNAEATELYRGSICTREEFEARMQGYRDLGFNIVGGEYEAEPNIHGDVLVLVGDDVWLT